MKVSVVSIKQLLEEFIFDIDWRYIYIHENGKFYSNDPYDDPDAIVIGWWKLVGSTVEYEISEEYQPEVTTHVS